MAANEVYLNDSLRKIAKGAGITFFGAMAGMFIGLLVRVAIARFLGPEDYGLFSLGEATLIIALSISMIGLATGVVRYVSFYNERKDVGRVKGTIISSLKMGVFTSSILTGVLFFGAGWISLTFFHEPNLVPVLRIFVISLPFLVLAQILLVVTVGFQDMKYNVYVRDLFQNIFRLPIILFLLFMGFGVLGATTGYIAAIIAMPFLAFYFLEKRVFSISTTKIKSIPVGRELLYYSLPLIFVTFSAMVMRWMDTLMLGYFCAAYEVGIYNAIAPIARLAIVIFGSFAGIFMPVVSGLYSNGMHEELKKTYEVVTKWIFSITLPFLLIVLLFSTQTIEILFGVEYVSGAFGLCILVIAYSISAMMGLAERVISAVGRTKLVMWCMFVGAGANLTLNWMWIPLYGINGAALATTLSLILTSCLLLISAYHHTKINPFSLNYFKPVFAAFIACVGVYLPAKFLFGLGYSIYFLIPMLLVFLAIYSLLLLRIRWFKEEDVMVVKAVEERFGVKIPFLRGWAK